MCVLYTLLNVVSLMISVFCPWMPVMGFQKQFGWGVGEVSSINFVNLAKPLKDLKNRNKKYDVMIAGNIHQQDSRANR